MRKYIFIFCLLLMERSFAQNGSEPVLVTDMLKIKTVSNVTASKDGGRVAFALTTIEPLENSRTDYRYMSQLYLLDANSNAAPVQLTFARERSAQPSWSPDGRQLAFVRAVDGRSQIFILPLNGGEAWQLTRANYGASNPRWSPDGKTILFSSGISLKDLLKDSVLNPNHGTPSWPFEKPGFSKNEQMRMSKAKADPDGSLDEIRAYLQNDEADNKARVIDKLNFQDEMNISADMSFSHLFLIPVQADATPRALTRGFYSYNDASFTADGQRLLWVSGMDSLRHPDRVQENSIYLSDVSGKNMRLLLGKAGTSYSSPRLSPSGKWLAFLYSPAGFVSVPTLGIIPLNGSAADIISIPFDRSISNIVWSNDEKAVYFTAQSNGGAPVYRADLSSRKTEQLSDYNSGINSFDLAGNRIFFAKTEVSHPSDLFVADLNMKNARQASSFNEWVLRKKLSVPEKHSFVNEKGMTVEYWVMKPANYQPGKKYPLLLEIHGGPSSMWGPGESSMWHEFQYFCSKGYGIVYGNPRGSGGYGLEFLKGNMKDWGTGPTADVLHSLDKTVAEGWADSTNLFITGGSYAGYLVAWIIAHDHRFRAACSQRGVYDLATFFGEGNAWRLVPSYFGGYPWDSEVKQILQRESPISYVQNITTPYIIFHGDNDRRTGFVQGEMMYRSLKVLDRPVEYVRHPNATHEITRSGDNRQRIDQMLRTYEFFERYRRDVK